MTLQEIIVRRIQAEGLISFHDFMEMALYYPGLGYYTSENSVLGMEGDFYTSAYLSPVFGAMIGRQLEQMWQLTGGNDFTIVEFGAGTGLLCHDILDYLKTNFEFYEQLQYHIVEKSPKMQKREKEHLHNKVTWHFDTTNMQQVKGCILSNELTDNFAVHRVVMQNKLMEVFVDYKEGFAEVLQPASEELCNYFDVMQVVLPKGYCTEVNLQAIGWINDVANCLQQGYVITIDYGFTKEALYHTNRNSGTLMCYHKHQLSGNPYSHIGEQDITSHVNFSALCQWGEKSGLANCGLTSQANFLLGLGFKDYLLSAIAYEAEIIRQAQRNAWLSHILLVDMGARYKVLIQAKEADGKQLMGLSLQEQ